MGLDFHEAANSGQLKRTIKYKFIGLQKKRKKKISLKIKWVNSEQNSISLVTGISGTFYNSILTQLLIP